MIEIDKIWLRAWVLRKLFTHKFIGGRHTNFGNIPKGAPKHQWHFIKEVAKELVKEGFLLTKRTSYGLEVSINPRIIAECLSIIKKFYLDFEV